MGRHGGPTLPALRLVGVAGGSQRRCVAWVEQELEWRVEVARPRNAGVRFGWMAPGQEPPTWPSGVRGLKRGWVVARTFAWLGRHRRLSQADAALPSCDEAWIYATFCLLLRRLAR